MELTEAVEEVKTEYCDNVQAGWRGLKKVDAVFRAISKSSARALYIRESVYLRS